MTELSAFYLQHLEPVLQRLKDGLNKHYYYHDVRHTLDVIEQSQTIGKLEGVSLRELEILKIAALFHDTGFLKVRTGHEQASVDFFQAIGGLSSLTYEDCDVITGCIIATHMPQNPKNQLERILCDADVDYLGREDFGLIAENLFLEMSACGEMSDRITWDNLQVKFLEAHSFHTVSNQERRNAKKEENLKEVRLRVAQKL
jgi:predicted metal-dependent HD superfamily phosphohydrolase